VIFFICIPTQEFKWYIAQEQPITMQAPGLWIDPETQCQFYTDRHGDVATPRLGTNGYPLCGYELPVGAE
jgi:hypothetical protein